MRPTPDELIGGARELIRQTLKDPTSVHSVAKLRRVMAVLRDFRWNDATFDLLRENDRLLRSLALLETGSASDGPGLTPQLEQAVSFVDLCDRNYQLRRLLLEQLGKLAMLPLDRSRELRERVVRTLLEVTVRDAR